MEEWSVLYEEHVDYVYRFLVYFLGNQQEAEDIAQETFIKAFAKWEQFDRRSGVRTWLIAIARHLAVDRVRRQQRGRLLQRLLRSEEPSPVQVPQEVLHASEQRRELYVAIRTLKPDQRAVVILKGIQDYGNKEVADVLGWTESKVRVTYHRAVKALGSKLMREEEQTYGMV
ncbi:MAG TPA: RNA polymerase sigma factor [Bacilli bacterium]|nr:RNA polymerase sigma factor [Bacilli bacterium]